MMGKAVDCADVRSGFVAGNPLRGPELEAHLRDCQPCRELFEHDAVLGRTLSGEVSPEPAAGELLALVERDLAAETGLRAKARAASAKVKLLGLLGLAGAAFLFHLVVRPRSNLEHYSALVFWSVVALLCAALLAGARASSSGLTAPLRARRIDLLVVFALLAAPFVAALITPLGEPSLEARDVWGSPAKCFGYGLAFASPLVLLGWLYERREVIPPRVLVLTGALAGVAANLLLHAHCPSVNLGHLLVGHASIGVALAALVVLVATSRAAKDPSATASHQPRASERASRRSPE